MVTYKELRERVQGLKKYKGCIKIDRSPLINECYPGQFNLSFTEYPWIREFGKYFGFDHDYVFSTIQSCIRWADIYDEKTKQSKLISDERQKYLGVFEMADLNGMIALAKKTDSLQLQRMQAGILFSLLDSLGIERKKIFPSYCIGGKVNDITMGKYALDFIVPSDEIGIQVFIEQGVPEENIISNNRRDTFLAIKLQTEDPKGKGSKSIPTPWGYRNEIHVNIGTREKPRFIDIGTLERDLWAPIYDKNNKIIELKDLGDAFSIGAVGLERLCMVANGLESVQEVDCIKPLYDESKKIENKELVLESLRALHRVYSDVVLHDMNPRELGKQRTARLRKLKRWVLDSGLDYAKIKELLEINTNIQPWHQKLAEGKELTIDEIKRYEENIK